jgi:hypothetical protein
MSLDGKSLILPQDGVYNGDDLSSINTSLHGGYRHELQILGLVEHAEDDLERPAGGAGAGTNASSRYEYCRKSAAYGGTNSGSASSAASAASPIQDTVSKDSEEKDGGGCIPRWIADAPTWLKIVIVLATALLVGAIVLIGVGAGLAVQENNANNNANTNSNTDAGGFPFFPSPLAPTTPTLPPAMDAPTAQGGGNPSPTAPPPKPNSTPTKAPIVGTAVPTAPTTLAPTVDPTMAPTQSSVKFFATGGRYSGTAGVLLPEQLQTLPNLDGNSIMFHLGDWNSPSTTSCVRESYIANDNLYNKSSVPVYFVPGDNEYNGEWLELSFFIVVVRFPPFLIFHCFHVFRLSQSDAGVWLLERILVGI